MKAYVESMVYGFMVYWDEEKDAARYFVHLIIGDNHKTEKSFVKLDVNYQEIGVIELDRNTKYYSFTNLAKIDVKINQDYSLTRTDKNYYVFVEAEDKNGKIISKTEKVRAVVETFSNTLNGTLVVRR